jgi:hypothetical protein
VERESEREGQMEQERMRKAAREENALGRVIRGMK